MADRSLLPCNSRGYAGPTSSSASNFVPVRCEFCELEFKCDLDVSRHLASEKHRNSLDQFLAVQNQVDKTIQKDIPKRLDQVFQAIKVRDVKDLKDLADKGFFEVNDESIAEIGQRLALSLFKAYVEYTSQTAPPRIAAKFIETVVAAINDHDNDTTQNTTSISQAFPTTSSHAQTSVPSTSKQVHTSPRKTQQAAAPQPDTNNGARQQTERQKLKSPVNLIPTPQPASTSSSDKTMTKPAPKSGSTANLATQKPTSSNRSSSTVKPNLSRASATTPATTATAQPPRSTPSNPVPRQGPTRATVTKPTNVVSQPPPPASSNQQSQRTVPTTTATMPQTYRPAPASVLAQRSGQTPQVARANQAVPQPTSTTSANQSQTNPTVITPLPGTIRVEPVPKPIEQSTYQVKFAKIKSEPQE